MRRVPHHPRMARYWRQILAVVLILIASFTLGPVIQRWVLAHRVDPIFPVQ